MARTARKRAVDEWIDAVLSADGPSSATQRIVCIVLARFMNWETLDGAYPGPALVATMTGLHIVTAKHALADLCEEGWLEQTSKGGSSPSGKRLASIYMGTYPESHARGPVALRASTRSGARADPSRTATPTDHERVKDPVNDQERASLGGSADAGRRAPPRSRKRAAKDNVGNFANTEIIRK